MADGKQQGQGTTPPLDQSNEPLPRSYNQLLGTNNPQKTSWPELVGVTTEEAERKIKEEMSGVEIQVVPPGSFVTADFKTQRVRLYVDESGMVTRTPGIG
ncbi:subtilisin inhibitor CLSI-I-like [Lotus japonicus]|uniref:subtilisin inhibitor CLSI-I-like n=1 Tax=Lotus japonicus TaxID=34305 RepID=UPI002582D5D1|nr:subtilisin inhibitor CLSI-I-like [Lotus japonicus]